MQTEFRADIFFHLTGKRREASLGSIEGLNLRPALFARYRDLATLRYDFPLVLAHDDSGDGWVQSLSGLFDSMLQAIVQGADGERLSRQALRLEREIRTLVPEGAPTLLSALWDDAASRLSAGNDPIRDGLERLRTLLALDGEIIDCDKAAPGRLLRHAWETVQRRKARRFHELVDSLIVKLSEILQADFAHSEEGHSARSLRASFGPAYEEAFDFEAMSRLLAKNGAGRSHPGRNRRVRWLLSVLRSQRFFPAHGRGGGLDEDREPYAFDFENCASALEAYRERLPKMIELARALMMARLEIDGQYEESILDPFFEDFGADRLDPNEAALFPDYFIHLNVHKISAVDGASVIEALAAGLPIKVLLQTDDLSAPWPLGNGKLALGLPGRQIASSLIGVGETYVLQSSSSNLFRFRDRIYRGMDYGGPTLFHIFSGAAEGASHLPSYMVAAAAMESRAFPAFVYNPAAGRDWASRFLVQENPQADADWPVHILTFEDEAHQKVSESLAFTLVDFLACDRRHARNFATVPRSAWNGNLVPVSECLADETGTARSKVPYLLMVDANDVLQRVIVDDKLVQEARHCRDMWRSLQELGGIHNSHAERLLARERRMWEEQLRPQDGDGGNGEISGSQSTVSAPPVPAGLPLPQQVKPEPEPPSGEAYIETARCTSCNECIHLNNQMFAYNQQKQAFIANLEAGTYRQLVEAAESCPVCIIHPGKPRNPEEPGIEEFLKRAEPFS